MTPLRLIVRSVVLVHVFGSALVLHAEPKVGVYYYPWYGTFGGGHSVNQSLRGHLAPPQPPGLGVYSSRNAETIAAHIDQSHQGNIDFWALSWWGPDSAENLTIYDNLLTHARAGELKYAIHYESTGRLGPFENPNFNNLVPDFRYLADNYFQNPNYLKIDDRPVVFMYVTRAYFNSQASRDAIATLRLTMLAEFGVDPYIVGDDLFGGDINVERAQLWDAITDFDVYGTVLQGGGSTSAALNQLASFYDSARQAIANTNVGFIPSASPGFNDKGVRDGHPAAPRYMTDDPNSREGDLFARMLEDVVVSRTDPKADNILMINSFNEWHEDTQIEPTIVAPRTNLDDSGVQHFTEGKYYEGYGDLYLNLLSKASRLAGDFNRDGKMDAADYAVWRKNPQGTFTGNNYNIWHADFGMTVDGGSSQSGQSVPGAPPRNHISLPESASVTLLILGAAGWLMRPTVLRMRIFIVAALCLFAIPGIASANGDASLPVAVNATIDRGLAFLVKDSLAWKEKYGCDSCHHAALITWSMCEAKQHGFAVDESVLAEGGKNLVPITGAGAAWAVMGLVRSHGNVRTLKNGEN